MSLALAVSDADNDAISFVLSGQPSGLQISGSGVTSGTLDYAAAEVNGDIYNVMATDSRGASAR